MLKIKSEYFPLIFLIVLFIFIYSFIGINKHLHFQTFGWDTAIFDQQVYLISQLKPPFSSLHGFIGLGDHFHPLLYIVGGLLYKLWSNAGMLFIIQSVVLCLSAWPLYLINKKVLEKVKFSTFQKRVINLILVLMYFVSVSFQFMAVGEYNDASTLALPLLFALYFLLVKKYFGFVLSFILVLLTKEEYCLLGIPLSIFIALEYKKYRLALLTFILGVGTFFLLTYKIMPLISGTEYLFFSENNQPGKIIPQLLTHPLQIVTKLFDDPEKRKTIFISLFSFGALPLFSLVNLVLPGFNLAIRFYDSTVLRRYEFNNQYSAGLIPPLAVASVYGLVKVIDILLKKKIKISKIYFGLLVYLILVIILQDLIFHGPINSLLKPSFYRFTGNELAAHELIKNVPKDAVLSANNSLLPHLSQRENFYLLPKVGDAEYIAVDLADGPNKFAPLKDAQEMKKMIEELKMQKKFNVVWQKGDAILLRRN